MSKETVTISGTAHEIDVKPITIVCKSPKILDKIEYHPERVRLEPEVVVYHAERVQMFHHRTAELVAYVFELEDSTLVTPDWCRSKGREVLQVAGLIDMSLKLFSKGVPCVWVEPESGLHPRHQCQLADVLIQLMQTPVKTSVEEMVDEMLPDCDIET